MYSPEVIRAIKADPLATSVIELAILFLYVHFKDFRSIARDGQVMFEDPGASILYHALCELVGRKESPEVTGVKVRVGGTMVPVAALQELERSVQSGAKSG